MLLESLKAHAQALEKTASEAAQNASAATAPTKDIKDDLAELWGEVVMM